MVKIGQICADCKLYCSAVRLFFIIQLVVLLSVVVQGIKLMCSVVQCNLVQCIVGQQCIMGQNALVQCIIVHFNALLYIEFNCTFIVWNNLIK